MKSLPPIRGMVLLEDAAEKLVVIDVLQIDPSESKVYDYSGVPYSEGYVGSDNNLLFSHSDTNDIISSRYENPECEALTKAMGILYSREK